MLRNHSQTTALRRGIMIVATVTIPLLMLAESAFGLAFTVSQIGGTAANGQGIIGDTVTVAVDFTIDEDELMLGAFPTIWWDQAGGNVLDVVSAVEGGSATLGGMAFNPISSNYLLFDNADAQNANVRSFGNGTGFNDSMPGTTYMVGFESSFNFAGDDAALAIIIANGAPGPATIRMGEITFRLSGLGTTTIGTFFDPTGASTISSLVAGPRGIVISGDDIEFTDLPVSSIGFGTLSIVVVPEPSTAIMFALGLAGLASKGRRR